MHPFCRPQIAGLIVEETSIKISNEYVDFVDIFCLDLTSKLPEYTEINDHAIKLVDSQQPLYRPICKNVTLGAGAESSRSGSHVTTIIQTSPWSTWPPPQRLTQPGSHLEPRFLLILRTQPPTRLLTVYVVGRYFRLWELFVLCPLVEEMKSLFLELHWMAWSLSSRLDRTGFAPPLCVDVSLV